MIKSEYYVVGCMSGTSLDGLDIAYIKFQLDTAWRFEIITATTIPYSDEWKNKLKSLVSSSKIELQVLDEDYTVLLADKINSFIVQNRIQKLDAICSHGHTALHQPSSRLTYQIGNLQKLAKILNKLIICDFRVQDVEYGGQGAPLVPIGDELLFSDYDYCLNLGGFANISFKKHNKRLAFDICPVNIVLNFYMNKIDKEYDDQGKLASSGVINERLLHELNALDFYKLKHPKSLGYEWVQSKVFSIIDSYELDIKDILRTFVAHIVFQITKVLNNEKDAKLLLTGGGAYNKFLISELRKATLNTLILPKKKIIEYKEALIFGFLGVLKLRNEVNCLASVTGAFQDHCSGKIYEP